MAALAGGLLWAIANTYAVVGAPVTPPVKVIVLCLIEAVCSVTAAGITGWNAGAGICDLLHVTDAEVVSVLALAFACSSRPCAISRSRALKDAATLVGSTDPGGPGCS